MRTSLFSILFFLILFSCKQEETIPDYVISEQEMVNVLVDVELTQAEIKFSLSSEELKMDYNKKFEKVFDKHKLTQETFNKNLEYYCRNPLVMKDLYDQVIVRLSEDQASLEDDFVSSNDSI